MTLQSKRLQRCVEVYGDGFRFRLQNMVKEIQKDLPPGPLRAKAAHQTVDTLLSEALTKNPMPVSCKSKCSFCCYQKIPLTDSEYDLVMGYAQRAGWELGEEKRKRLKRQHNAIKHKYWDHLRQEDKKCVFLDDDNLCSVYEERPMACRVHLVVSDPKKCNTQFGVQDVGIVQVPSVDMALTAFMLADGVDGVEETITEKMSE